MNRLAKLFRLATGRPAPQEDIDDEIALHLALREQELIEEGWDPAAARQKAKALFGDREAIARQVRAIDHAAFHGRKRRESMQRLFQDIKVSLRTLLRRPGFALSGVSIVGLGVGAATAMFTVLNAAFLRPFAYSDPDRIVYVWEKGASGQRMRAAGPNAKDWGSEVRSFSQLAYFNTVAPILTESGDPEYLSGAGVSLEFANVLGMAPLKGRWWSAEEARPGGAPVLVVSEGLWRRRFGGDPGLVGRSLRLDGKAATVVGIMPASLSYPVGAEFWTPAEPMNTGSSRTAHNWRVIARLAPGVTVQAAGFEVDALTKRLIGGEKPSAFVATGALVVPFREQLVGDSRTVLFLLQGAVLLVLAIAAVNLTNLTLARAVRRQGEVGVCLALGARRSDVIRRFAYENVAITLIGGVLGLGLAAVLRGVLIGWVGSMMPFVKQLPLDARVAGFALLLALLVGLASSIVPAWRASGGTMASLTPARGGTITKANRRLIDALMAAEVAIAVMLVAGAGLVGRSLLRLGGTDLGFSYEQRLVATLPLSPRQGSAMETKAAVIAAYDRLLDETRAAPGTISATAVNDLPLLSSSANGSAQVEGTASASGGPPAAADFRIVSPGFFQAQQVSIRRGREFGEGDVAGTPYVAVVNEAFVKAYLVGRDPLTARVRFPGMDSMEDAWADVVGVVGDTRQDGFGVEPAPAIYYCYKQRLPWQLTLVVHSSAPAARVMEDLKARVAAIDPAVPFRARPWSEIGDRNLELPRVRSILLALFAAIALILSAVGIAAVVAFSVAQRTREIGLRVAVGASPAAITRDGVLRTARPVIAGLGAGVAGALLLGKTIRSLLYGLAPNDALTLGAAALVTVLVALLAAYIPARRAVRIDPLVALREE